MYKILKSYSEAEGMDIYLVINRITNKVEGTFTSKSAAKAYVLAK